MQNYAFFALKRLLQLLAVIVCGCSIAFLIAHLSPISPVDQILARVTGKSNFDPNSIIELRRVLTELFGLDVPLHEQYVRCGIRDRDDTGYMKSVDPAFEAAGTRW